MKHIMAVALLLFAVCLGAAKPVVNTHYYEIRHVMKCRVHLPVDYDANKAYPLLIALHGRGGSAQDFDSLWEQQAKV